MSTTDTSTTIELPRTNGLINRAALRRHVVATMEEWQIHRQALPKGAFNQLVADVELAATRLTLAIIGPLKSPPPETASVTHAPLP